MSIELGRQYRMLNIDIASTASEKKATKKRQSDKTLAVHDYTALI
jgi:hypothetical protein